MKLVIDRFMDEYAFLSNFAPCKIEYGGRTFPTVENAYQSAKCAVEADIDKFQYISAGDAKRLGRKVLLREDWEMVKLSVMEDLLRRKFSNIKFKELLLDTGDVTLIEGNTWNDTFWGICNGVGENNLGKLLMKIRDEIRKGIEDYE